MTTHEKGGTFRSGQVAAVYMVAPGEDGEVTDGTEMILLLFPELLE